MGCKETSSIIDLTEHMDTAPYVVNEVSSCAHHVSQLNSILIGY